MIYFLITWLRNKLYDLGILKSYSFSLPKIISVGNLTVGGTGKTPHIEFFVEKFLSEGKRVAVISRGYKRKTKGFLLATEADTAYTIGDEPYQIFCKFPQITVAVDSDRVRAVQRLMDRTDCPDIILLDDAFQHRRIVPWRQIVLVDFNRPIFSDYIMPYGRLREARGGIKRASEVIVTKCPIDLSEEEKRSFAKKLKLKSNQPINFSTFEFLPPKNIFNGHQLVLDKRYNFQIITGVVSPQSLYLEMEKYATSIYTTKFGDHHFFSSKDIDFINKETEQGRIVIVTEKDASRLLHLEGLTIKSKQSIYSVVIKVKFI